MKENIIRNKGLLIVMTGNGKGKTTSALGMAFRALGHGFPVCMVQFIKGSWKYGELISAKKFKGLFDLHVMGRGFTWKSDDLEKDKASAKEAWEYAKEIIKEGKHHLVILDELTYLITYNMVDIQDILKALLSRPSDMHIVVTGRGADKQLIDAADMVTEMRDIKHPYSKGIKAQRGIEY